MTEKWNSLFIMMTSKFDDNSVDQSKINQLLRMDIYDFFILADQQEKRQAKMYKK